MSNSPKSKETEIMAMTGKGVENTKLPMTTYERALSVKDATRQVYEEISGIADKLCGSVPRDDGNQQVEVVGPGGLFNKLDETFGDTLSILNDIDHEIQRIRERAG